MLILASAIGLLKDEVQNVKEGASLSKTVQDTFKDYPKEAKKTKDDRIQRRISIAPNEYQKMMMEDEKRREITEDISKDYSNQLQKSKDYPKEAQKTKDDKIQRRISIAPQEHHKMMKEDESRRETAQDISKEYLNELQTFKDDQSHSENFPSEITKSESDELQKATSSGKKWETLREISLDKNDLNKMSAAGSRRETLWEQSIRGFQISFMASIVSALEPKNLFWVAEQLPGGDYYDGQWNRIGMSGGGSYALLNEVEYAGGMVDSRFHGYGVLNYPDGIRVEGKWENGVLNERQIVFSDDLTFTGDDTYAQQPDRRFFYEITMGMNPAGCSVLTDRKPTRKIPPGYYDTEDGFYDPVRNVVVDADDLREIIRIPKDPAWIISHCRKAWDEPVGPRPDLFEQWMECKVPNEKNEPVTDKNNENLMNLSLT